ncbi:hypothetical protein J6590_009838 [Homalodisca vitripennis]|nr:hypothetical protein J6590_009838 [Homalodisca vitripennis]
MADKSTATNLNLFHTHFLDPLSHRLQVSVVELDFSKATGFSFMSSQLHLAYGEGHTKAHYCLTSS